MRKDLADRLLLPVLLPLAALAFVVAIAFGLSRILLAVTHTGAVIVAIVVAATILGMAALVAAMPRIRTVQLVSLLGVVAGVALITGGVVSATITEQEADANGEPGPPVVAIGAPAGSSTEGFAQTEVTAPALVPFVIEFDNADPSVPHNVAVLSEEGGEAVAAAEIVTGPAVVEYEIPALDPGEYPFVCEVHPQTMTGTLIAEEGVGRGDGGGGPADIVAPPGAEVEGFDRSELTLVAGEEATIVFDNRDDGVQHNFSIYTEQGGVPILQEPPLPGPDMVEYTVPAQDPGEYFFQCDVHPATMNGTVLVE